MPRTVDHDARRAELAEAVWRLAARAGLEAVSLRSVATEAGVSMGRVQYYFATKDDLLLHSLDLMQQRIGRRIEQRAAATAGDDRALLAVILDELLGGHPQTREAIRVNLAYAARAREDEKLAEVLTDGDDEILALCVHVVAQAKAAGRAAPDVDAERDGYALWTLTRGLGTDVAVYGAPIGRARAVLGSFLDRVAPPE